MTDLIDTVQLQEIDDAYVELFDITLPDANSTKVYLFNGMDEGTANIYFPQTQISGSVYPLKEYVALPIQLEGTELNAAGALARPSLRLANIPTLTRSISSNSDGVSDEDTLFSILSDVGILKNEDFLNTRIVYRRTLLSHTYRNTDSNPSSPPVEFPSQVYIVDRISSETNIFAEFELASPMDIEGLKLPGRVVIGKYCVWRYQGIGLSNEGGCSWPLSGNGRFFDENDNLITRNISTISAYSSSSSYTKDDRVKTTSGGHTQIWEALVNVPAGKPPSTSPAYWKRLDVCSKTLTGCKKRFQGNNSDDTLSTTTPLPFGGFPGTKKFK